jgi:hypothetical protein
MTLYAYCVGGEELTEVGGSVGVGDGEVRLVSVGGLSALVSEFAGERVALTRENVLRHNEVVSRVLRRTTPLPFRFGTLVSEARLREYAEANRAALEAALARVRGCVEMSVKIMWDAAQDARREASSLPETDDITSPQAEGLGATYLRAKLREFAGGAALKERSEEIAAWLAGALGDAVRETRARLSPEDTLVVRAAHLVERERLDVYRERVRAAREERVESLRFLTSGAWPPYSFCDLGEISKLF